MRAYCMRLPPYIPRLHYNYLPPPPVLSSLAYAYTVPALSTSTLTLGILFRIFLPFAQLFSAVRRATLYRILPCLVHSRPSSGRGMRFCSSAGPYDRDAHVGLSASCLLPLNIRIYAYHLPPLRSTCRLPPTTCDKPLQFFYPAQHSPHSRNTITTTPTPLPTTHSACPLQHFVLYDVLPSFILLRGFWTVPTLPRGRRRA